jgi:hypothetical protein
MPILINQRIWGKKHHHKRVECHKQMHNQPKDKHMGNNPMEHMDNLLPLQAHRLKVNMDKDNHPLGHLLFLQFHNLCICSSIRVIRQQQQVHHLNRINMDNH